MDSVKVPLGDQQKDKKKFSFTPVDFKEMGEKGTFLAVGKHTTTFRWWRFFTIIFLIISVIILTVGASRYSEYDKIPKNDTTAECTKHFSPKDDITMMTFGSLGTVVFGFIAYIFIF